MTSPRYQRRPAAAPHSFELVRGESVEARLEWRQDVTHRGALGWFVRIGHARAPRRLDVDPAIAALAADGERASAEWSEDADSLAMLTAGVALHRAEQLLRGLLGSPPEAGDPQFTPGPYEILVSGCDAVAVAVVLPTTAIYEWGGMVVVTDEFDQDSLRAMLDRLAQIGAEVVGVLPAGGS
jgi:hypothetical protein